MPTITRKIQINPTGDKEERNNAWKILRVYEEAAYRAANYVSTHAFVQEKLSEFNYFHEDYKIKLVDRIKNEEGILKCSGQNTTYRMLSEKMKPENIPSGIYNQVNSVVRQTFAKEKRDYFKGAKSLRSYKKGMPIPIGKKDIRKLTKEGDNYTFSLYGINFKTYFGKDLSDNESIIDRCMGGDYKLCDSSVQIKKNKLFLLAVVSFEKEEFSPDPKKIADVYLDPEHPIIIKTKRRSVIVGSGVEYLYRRKSIKDAMMRLQKSLRFAKSGKGRKSKMEALERFSGKEKEFVNNRMHNYSRGLIDYCLKNKIGKIVLNNFEEIQDSKEEVQSLLPGWSYFNLASKIVYKAAIHGITVEIPKTETKPKEYEAELCL